MSSDKITTKLFNYNEDYATVTKWWVDRKHAIIDKDFLSDYGVMVSIGNKQIGCMWLYPMVTTKWSMIRFPITNPDTTKEERNIALDVIFENLHNISKDMGYKYIFCTTNTPSLIKRLEKYNYILDSVECSHYYGKLG